MRPDVKPLDFADARSYRHSDGFASSCYIGEARRLNSRIDFDKDHISTSVSHTRASRRMPA
jgi:hypothetical protein